MTEPDAADRLVDAILTDPTPDPHNTGTVDLLRRAADTLDHNRQTRIPAPVAHALAVLFRAEAAGLHATLGMPGLLDAAAGEPTGTELRVRYSTIPELTAVARAVLDTAQEHP